MSKKVISFLWFSAKIDLSGDSAYSKTKIQDNGIVHWEMLTRENLEIAAGMYIFQVESEITGDTMLGKFAVIK